MVRDKARLAVLPLGGVRGPHTMQMFITANRLCLKSRIKISGVTWSVIFFPITGHQSRNRDLIILVNSLKYITWLSQGLELRPFIS